MTWEYWYSIYASVHGLQKCLLLLACYLFFWISSAFETTGVWLFVFLLLDVYIVYLQPPSNIWWFLNIVFLTYQSPC
jgi:hypothetical protein